MVKFGLKKQVPGMFLVQSRNDWDCNINRILTKHSCIIKTVILPKGLQINDPVLSRAELVEERSYTKAADEHWKECGEVFEADIDSRLLPKAVNKLGNAHLVVYPSEHFESVRYAAE